MVKPFIIDITENNTPITAGATPAGKKGSCGGRCGGACGSTHDTGMAGKNIRMMIVAAGAIGLAAACYFIFA